MLRTYVRNLFNSCYIPKTPNQTKILNLGIIKVLFTTNPQEIKKLYSDSSIKRSGIATGILGVLNESLQAVRDSKTEFYKIMKSNLDERSDSSNVYISQFTENFLRVFDSSASDIHLELQRKISMAKFKVDYEATDENLKILDEIAILYSQTKSEDLYVYLKISIWKKIFPWLAKKLERKHVLSLDHRQKNFVLYSKLYKTLPDSEYFRKLKATAGHAGMFDDLAGTRSFALSLYWTLYLLAKNPKYQEKIIENPKYSKLVYWEALRMKPSFHILTYETGPGNCPFFRKTQYMIPVLGVHMDKRNFDDPDMFTPERFEEGVKQYENRWIPFGGGDRICPGRSFVLKAGPDIILNLVKKYSLVSNHDVKAKKRITLNPDHHDVINSISFKERT